MKDDNGSRAIQYIVRLFLSRAETRVKVRMYSPYAINSFRDAIDELVGSATYYETLGRVRR